MSQETPDNARSGAPLSEHQFRSLFDHLPTGAAYHKVVYDGQGLPVDFVFLEINKAFEKEAGLKRLDLIGRRVSRVLPSLVDDSFDWIGTYGRVARTGQSITFEQFWSPWIVGTLFRRIRRRRTIEELTLKEEQLQCQNEKQSAFLRISQVVQEMTQPEDLETVLSVCLEQLRRIGVRADTMAIHRVVEPQGLLVETYRVGLNGLVQSPHRRRSRHIVTIWITREPFIRTDMEETKPSWRSSLDCRSSVVTTCRST